MNQQNNSGRSDKAERQRTSEVARGEAYQRHLPHQVPPGVPIFLTWNLKGSLPARVIEKLAREQQRLLAQPKRDNETDAERKLRHGKLLFAKRDRSLDQDCHDMYVGLSRLTPEAATPPAALDLGSADGIGGSVSLERLAYGSVSLERLAYGSVSLERLTYEGRPMWLADPRAAAEVVKSLLWGVPDRYQLLAYAVLGNHVHALLTPRVALKTITQGIKGFTAFQINRLQNARGRTLWQDESFDHWVRDEAELFRVIEYIEMNPVAAGLCQRPAEWPWSSARWRKALNWQRGEPFQPAWKAVVESALEL